MHAAVHGNQPGIIQLLLEYGASASPRHVSKCKACGISQRPRKPLPDNTLFSSLVYNSPTAGALQTAAASGNLLLIKTLLSAGVKVDEDSKAGDFSALQISTFKGYTDVVNFLLDHSADVNAVGKLLARHFMPRSQLQISH